jgi:hypothetical protein
MPVARSLRGGHTPPLPEGVRAVRSSPRIGHTQRARPRSAVAVSLSAPGLSPLTGFSRSGNPAPKAGSSSRTMYPFGVLAPSLGFTASGGPHLWTGVVPCVYELMRDHRFDGLSEGLVGPLAPLFGG